MTAFEKSPKKDVQQPTPNGRITVSMHTDTTRSSGEAEGPISIWLYVAGAIVTLSALYAVNFTMEDSGFAILSYVLAVIGYCSSYSLRLRGISLRGLQVPLFTLLGFFFLLSLLFGQGIGVAESPSRNLQIALTWVAILHSYTLSNNSAVLFACVPGMTLIALVSTSTTEVEAQNAFLAFFCAATFLLIHENYLRTQAQTRRTSETSKRSMLFFSQAALAVGCFLSAILLAHLTVVPMQAVGERLFPQGTIKAITGAIRTNLPSSLSGNERTNYELASGPVTATNSPILEVHCDEPHYWRGGTFDTYTGHSFTNNLPTISLSSSEEPYPEGAINPNKDSVAHFQIPAQKLDLEESEMKDSHQVRQHFKMLAVNTPQIYGAGRIQDLASTAFNIQTDYVGTLALTVPLQAGTEYDVISVVPSSSPDILRASPSDQIPLSISETYLQTRPPHGAENPELRRMAALWTRDEPTNYDKVLAIRRNISNVCNYNLNTPAAPRDKDIVAYFLTESHQGYCDSFGAAMTMMCRYAGIPARMAIGFMHGDETSTHVYTVKDKDRHIWTEVFFPNVGWVPFDATDGANDITEKVDTTHKKKLTLLGWMAQQGIGPKAIELIVLVLLAYIIKTELIDRFRFPNRRSVGGRDFGFPASNIAIQTAYHAAIRQLARRGLVRAPSMTAVEFGAMVRTQMESSAAGAALSTLTELHNRYFYGNETAPQQEVQQAQDALNRLIAALNAYKAERGKAALTTPATETA